MFYLVQLTLAIACKTPTLQSHVFVPKPSQQCLTMCACEDDPAFTLPQSIVPTYRAQYDKLKNGEYPKGKLVLLGDSITASLRVQNSINMGIGYDTWENALLRMWMVHSVQPSKVFMMFGINDIHMGHTDDRILKNAKMLLGYVKANTNSTITVHSVINMERQYKRRVQTLNIKLKRLCNYMNVQFINRVLGRHKFVSDMIHLNQVGINHFVRIFEKKVYKYPTKTDSAYECWDYQFKHYEKLTFDDLRSPLANDWELPVFTTIYRYAMAASKLSSKYLDLGCGTGRIIQRYSGIFSETTCLEPDTLRIMEAQKLEFQNPAQKIEYVQQSLFEFETTRKFGFVTCIQMIQHIATHAVENMFEHLKTLVTDDAFVVIVTTLVDKPRLTFSTGQIVSIDAFNKRAINGDANDLAVRMYGYREIETMATSHGWHIVEHKPFGFDQYNIATHQILILSVTRQHPVRTTVALRDLFIPQLTRLQKLRAKRICYPKNH